MDERSSTAKEGKDMAKRFPDDSTGMVEGPDGPMRRSRANTLAGFTEPVLPRGIGVGRSDAFMQEEDAALRAHFLEDK